LMWTAKWWRYEWDTEIDRLFFFFFFIQPFVYILVCVVVVCEHAPLFLPSPPLPSPTGPILFFL
jgi:hypothetical protein